MKALIDRLHARLGDFWWYSLLMFAALRFGDVVNAYVGLFLVPKYVGQEDLGAVLPLTQFATSVGAPMTVLVLVFSKFLNKFKTLGEDGKIKSMLHWFIGMAVAIVLVSSAASLIILPHFFERLSVTSGSLTVLIIATGLLTTTAPVFTNALQGLKRFNTISFINIFTAPIRLAVMLIAMPFRALSGYMLGQLSVPAFQIFASFFALRKEMGKNIVSKPFWKEDGRDIAKFAIPLTICTIIGAIFTPITYMVIKQRLPEAESSAYYMISRFAELANYAGLTLAFVMYPLAAEAQTKGKESMKLLLHVSIGTLFFGMIVALVFFTCGDFIFKVIPTCRPYIGYTADLVIMSVMLTLGLVWTNYSSHEIANGRFWYYLYGGPITILQAAFLVSFTGYTYFNGILPDSIVSWMASLKIATLRNFLWAQLGFQVIRLIGMTIEIMIRARHNRTGLPQTILAN